MTTTGPPHVIVGVTGSLASLQALRTAVAEARRRGADLTVVQAHRIAYFDPLAASGVSESQAQAVHLQLRDWLHQALGGPPDDLTVRTTVVEGVDPGQALLGQVRCEDDLIVVGMAHQRRLGVPWRTGVAAYCVRRSTCPVLVTPPPRLARELGGTSPRRCRRAERELARELSAYTDTGGAPAG